VLHRWTIKSLLNLACLVVALLVPPTSGYAAKLQPGDLANIENACAAAVGKNTKEYYQCLQEEMTKLAAQPDSAPNNSGNQMPQATSPSNEFITTFDAGAISPPHQDAHITYNLNPTAERFYIHIPAAASSSTRFGLLVYIPPTEQIIALPEDWADVLDQRNLLFIAPLNAGNNQISSRRLGLAVLAALEMMRYYQIDPQRVYVSGLSGGARMAGLLGFYQPDVFHGTIQNCGADFYQPVPKVLAQSEVDTNGGPYGIFDATPDEINQAQRVRFALITGSGDFRHGNILDIYNGGFANSGLRAKLFDVKGMGHRTADATTLSAALDFVETGR